MLDIRQVAVNRQRNNMRRKQVLLNQEKGLKIATRNEKGLQFTTRNYLFFNLKYKLSLFSGLSFEQWRRLY